jgi:hypothetical protein
MTLVMAMSGILHTAQCRAKGRTYKCVAPDLALEDVAEFIRVRRFVACGVCLRDYREEVA